MTFKLVIYSGQLGRFEYSISDDMFQRWAELEGVELYVSKAGQFVNQEFLYKLTPDGKEMQKGDIPRDNENLIKLVEEMGDETPLLVVELPDDVKDNHYIDEDDYYGTEIVRERHRTWGG